MFKKLLVISLLLSSHASATLITETIDAGNTMPTAMVLAGGTTSIIGTIGDPQDTDLFKFTLDVASTFTIEVLEISAALDMNLIVFNSLGQGLAGDDNDNSCTAVTSLGSHDSCLTLSLDAGDYFFAVGDDDIAAFESLLDFNNAVDFIDNDWGILGSATSETLGLVGPENGPTDINDVGDYIVNFSQAVDGVAAHVSAPASIMLFSLGIVGMGLSRRRKSAR